jgi:TIR domain
MPTTSNEITTGTHATGTPQAHTPPPSSLTNRFAAHHSISTLNPAIAQRRMAMPASGIFINYRAEDSYTAAALIDSKLVTQFGSDHVFLDCRSIQIGTDFTIELLGRLHTCSILLAVIGPRWLTITNEAGGRRIDNPKDWIRLEIAAALRCGLRVVPVLLDGATLPTGETLPDDIAGLSRRQYLPLRLRYTDIDLDVLTERIMKADPTLADIATQRHQVPKSPFCRYRRRS